MNVATLVFAAVAAVGGVLTVVVASQPLLRIAQDRRRREDRITESYAEMFGRLYRFVMDDLDGDGHVWPESAKIFTMIAGNEMYLHTGSEAEAWQQYRGTHEF